MSCSACTSVSKTGCSSAVTLSNTDAELWVVVLSKQKNAKNSEISCLHLRVDMAPNQLHIIPMLNLRSPYLIMFICNQPTNQPTKPSPSKLLGAPGYAMLHGILQGQDPPELLGSFTFARITTWNGWWSGVKEENDTRPRNHPKIIQNQFTVNSFVPFTRPKFSLGASIPTMNIGIHTPRLRKTIR